MKSGMMTKQLDQLKKFIFIKNDYFITFKQIKKYIIFIKVS